MKPALFLDRDGVIIEEVGYLSKIEEVRLIPGAAEAIGRVNLAGFSVIIISNQAGVARGYFTEQRVLEVHNYIECLLDAHHARIDALYYCPHHPTEGFVPYLTACNCRKPEPGLLLKAAAEMDLSLKESFIVGDKESDILAGIQAGCHTILVRTGYGRTYEEKILYTKVYETTHIAEDLSDAVDIFLSAMK